MKYLKHYSIFERLNISSDIDQMLDEFINKEKSKVAALIQLISLPQSIYADDENLNNIDFSKDLNKLSFVPKKKRLNDLHYDQESMPTRIGKVVRNIYNKIKEKGYLKVDGEFTGDLTTIKNYSRKLFKFMVTEDYKDLGDFIFSNLVWLPKISFTISFEGKEMNFDIQYIRHEIDKTWNLLPVVCFSSDEEVPTEFKDQKGIKFYLKFESNLTITDKDIEDFVNLTVAYLKTNRADENSEIEEVKGEDIRFWYHIDNYQSESGELGSSCMAEAKNQTFLDIYCKNPDKISLLILKSKQGKLLARALLWKLDDGKFFMDRIYFIMASDCKLFYAKAKQNGWIYKRSREIMLNDLHYYTELRVTLKQTQFDTYPYLDTLCYLEVNKDCLTNLQPPGYYYYVLQETNGSYVDRSE